MSVSVGNETLQDIIESCVASVGKSNKLRNSFEKTATISGVRLWDTVIPSSGRAIQTTPEWWCRISMPGAAVSINLHGPHDEWRQRTDHPPYQREGT